MPDHRSEREVPDLTRRRLIAGIGLIGIGAIGGGLYRGLVDDPPGDDVGASAAVTSRPAVTSAPTAGTTEPTVRATTATTTVTTTTPPEVGVVVACRDAWGARPVGTGLVEHSPVRLTLHHTAVSQTAPNQGPARVRQHQGYHQSLGWPDIAYHFLVDRTGVAYEGRDLRFRGDTGTEYDPTGHFLVCMEGDFDTQEPAIAQLETTTGIFAWAAREFAIDPTTLAGHGTYAVTSCPGSSVVPLIPAMVDGIASSGPVTLERTCGPNGAALIEAIEASRPDQ